MKKLIISLSLVFFIFLIGCKKENSITTNSLNKTTIDSIKKASAKKILNTNFAKGADISWLTEMEASGIKFYNSSGKEQDLLAILKSKGMNAVRLRVWVNPKEGWNNLDDVLAKAERAQAADMDIMLEFHYSDTFADPAHQTKPAAWAKHTLKQLHDDIRNHTIITLTLLKENGIEPKWVQVGNEINDGMLWDEGKASKGDKNMQHFAEFITTGYKAVKSILPNAEVIVHISNGYENNLFRWVFDGITKYGAKYDVIGMSLYPAHSNDWQKSNNQCLDNMKDMVKRYGKKIMICEAGMPADQPLACKAFLEDLIKKTNSIKKGNAHYGLGVFYWEPQTYNNWKGYGKGAWGNDGKPTAALDAFLLE